MAGAQPRVGGDEETVSGALTRSPWVDRLNHWLDVAWAKGWATRPELAPEAILRRAGARPRDLGGSDWVWRLDALCEALNGSAALNNVGRTVAFVQVSDWLKLRRRLLARPEPALTLAQLPAPIIVVGQMRSGTTRVQRLLAADPALDATHGFETALPLPPRHGPDLRPLVAGGLMAAMRRFNPRFGAVHPTGVREPDEEIFWLTPGLIPGVAEALWRIPGYVRASEQADPGPAYDLFARILRLQGERRQMLRPRILKTPQFAEDLDTLLTLFPDARLVIVRRKREAVLASACSLVANQMTTQSDAVDPAWIAQEWRRRIALREARMDAALAKHSHRRALVEFAAMDADWEGTMAGVYRALDLDFSAVVRARMLTRVKKDAQRPHHHYRPGEFGLPRPA